MAIASPSYLAAAGRPAGAAGLAGHKLIHLEEPFRPTATWADWFQGLGVPYRDDGEGLRLNEHTLVVQAVLEGQGIALGWRHLSARLLASGLLVEAVPERLVTDRGFYVVWPRALPLSADARRVRDWLLDQSEG